MNRKAGSAAFGIIGHATGWKACRTGAFLFLVAILFFACSPKVADSKPPAASTSTPAPQPGAVSQLTAQERQSLSEFARSFAALENEWDGLHGSFETWFRSKTIPLEPDMEKHLGQLVAKFEPVKGQIAGLPGGHLTKALSDELFDLALEQEKALRALRDSWRPGDTMAFQRYEESRSTLVKSQVNIKKKLADLISASDPANKQEIEKFHKSFRELEASWDKFAQDFDRWKATGMEKDPPAKALPNMAATFRDIVSRANALPRLPVGQEHADLLVKAVEKEDLALNKLNDSFKPRSDEPFAAYELERLKARKLRSRADAGIETVRSAAFEGRAGLSNFSAGLDEIDKQWTGFHQDYDAWRNSASDAARDAITRDLREFETRLNGITLQARGLPQNALLRPLSEMVIGTAEKEQQSLRRLDETFRLYDASAWRAFAQDQQSAERSRRKIKGAFIDLLAKYNLTMKEM